MKLNPKQHRVVSNTSKPCPHLNYSRSSLSAHINNPKHCSEGQPLTFDPCINPRDLERGEERVLVYCSVFRAAPFPMRKLIGLRRSPRTNTHHLYVSAFCWLEHSGWHNQSSNADRLFRSLTSDPPQHQHHKTDPLCQNNSKKEYSQTQQQIHSFKLTYTRVCERCEGKQIDFT